MNYTKPRQQNIKQSFNRVNVLRVFVIIIGAILISRLFYVQIIRHEHYQAQALAEHIKKFEISAPRGIVSLSDGNSSVPIVLNEQRYTIYADPYYITDAQATAAKLVPVIGGAVDDTAKKLANKSSRYVILAKKMTKDQADRVEALDVPHQRERRIGRLRQGQAGPQHRGGAKCPTGLPRGGGNGAGARVVLLIGSPPSRLATRQRGALPWRRQAPASRVAATTRGGAGGRNAR